MITRANLHETFMRAYDTGKRRARVGRLFDEWEDLKVKEGGIGGASTPITTLRTRWLRTIPTAGNALSVELDFNIALRQGIEIFAVYCRLFTAAVTAVAQTAEALVDLDGPALASNAVSTQALYELRELLESVIANFGLGVDALTSGAAVTETLQRVDLPIPVLTARNPGVAALAIISNMEALVGIQHRFVEINRDENLELFALGRA